MSILLIKLNRPRAYNRFTKRLVSVSIYGLNKHQWLQVLASWGGWLMDGYTTIAYAFVAFTMATVFFPSGSKGLDVILAFAGFAVSAIARSVGSLLIGNFLGDKLGRRRMLVITILFFFCTVKTPDLKQCSSIFP